MSENVPDRVSIEDHEVAVDESLPAATNADALHAEMHCCAGYSSDCCVHAWRISAAG